MRSASLYIPTQTFIVASNHEQVQAVNEQAINQDNQEDNQINQVYAQNHLIPDHSDINERLNAQLSY